MLLNIIGLCEGGCASSIISERVDEWQRDNWSVYAPMTLCRMLERAGALVLEMPEVTDEHESVEEGVSYLEIRETVDPVWRSTPEALALREEYLAGKSFRAVVLAPTRRATPRCTARSWRRSPRRPGSWSTSRA